jgi:HPt (histidine-containing phosphotransfer) domain-containing protein
VTVAAQKKNKDHVINLATLEEICGGDKKFILEMIDLFLAQAESQVNDIENALLEKDCTSLKKSAHKFKSSAQIFGVARLVNLLIKIESSGLADMKLQEKKTIIGKVRDLSVLACWQVREERKNYT